MKQILILLLIGLSSSLAIAQDIIVKSNGEEIKSKVVEITIETIKYKEYEFQDGPIRNIKISDVFMIIYENGKRETFASPESQTSKEDTNNAVSSSAVPDKEVSKNADSSSAVPDKEVPQKKVFNSDYNGDYFMIGAGFGNSYGGFGLKVQWRMKGEEDFRIHAGIGYYPDAPILAAAGVKFFPYKDYYMNAQFGLTGWERYTSSSGNDVSHILFGPSFLLGVDWTWGSKIGYGFNAGLGISYNMNTESKSSLALALDLGFFLGF